MGDILLPGYEQDRSVRGSGGGTYTGGPWKVVMHTIEGSVNSALSVFRNASSASHLIVSVPSRPDGPRKIQLVPLNRSAFALQNKNGGAQTNRDSAIQVEMSGFARDQRYLTAGDRQWLADNVVRPIQQKLPIPSRTTKFYDEKSGVGTLAAYHTAIRWGATQWDNFSGFCGHQHVPENAHWDPGALNMTDILNRAGRPSTTSGVDNNTTDWAGIAAYLQSLIEDEGEEDMKFIGKTTSEGRDYYRLFFDGAGNGSGWSISINKADVGQFGGKRQYAYGMTVGGNIPIITLSLKRYQAFKVLMPNHA